MVFTDMEMVYVQQFSDFLIHFGLTASISGKSYRINNFVNNETLYFRSESYPLAGNMWLYNYFVNSGYHVHRFKKRIDGSGKFRFEFIVCASVTFDLSTGNYVRGNRCFH